jgi:hypothetical protein
MILSFMNRGKAFVDALVHQLQGTQRINAEIQCVVKVA